MITIGFGFGPTNTAAVLESRGGARSDTKRKEERGAARRKEASGDSKRVEERGGARRKEARGDSKREEKRRRGGGFIFVCT